MIELPAPAVVIVAVLVVLITVLKRVAMGSKPSAQSQTFKIGHVDDFVEGKMKVILLLCCITRVLVVETSVVCSGVGACEGTASCASR